MTNAELIQAIKAEIERLKGICAAQIKVNPGQTFPFVMEMTGYDKLLSFLDTLESEKPTQEEWELNSLAYLEQLGYTCIPEGAHMTVNQDGLEEELNKWRHNHFNGKRDDHFSGEYLERTSQLDLARHFAKWGAEHAKIDVTDFCKPIDPGIAQCIADHFWEMLGEDEKPVPNDLEEAAKHHSEQYRPHWPNQVRPTYDAFIAGAKWAFGQGLVMEGVAEGNGDDVCWLKFPVLLSMVLARHFKPGDKVVVQIRKKKEKDL